MYFFVRCWFFCIILFAPLLLIANLNETRPITTNVNHASKTLSNGWYLLEPYQYNKARSGGFQLTGMDIELIRTLARRLDIEVDYEYVEWKEHQRQLKLGIRDIAAGATYTDEREEYAYFSVPYRFEENSLFVSKNASNLKFASIVELLVQIRRQNFVLGVINGFVYADSQINLFISHDTNKDIIKRYENNVNALAAMIRGEIDGFISDRVGGAAAILNAKVVSQIKEIKLNIKTPVHLMFSKKTTVPGMVEQFDREINKFKKTEGYKDIIKTYLYPVLILSIIESDWFYFIGIIGTISFTMSGIALSFKNNATLFNTILLSMIPSVGGSIMRDVLVNKHEVVLFLNPSYMYCIIIVVLISFSATRVLLLEHNTFMRITSDKVSKFWGHMLIIGDALGQAALIGTGVCMVMMTRIEPIILWGPFFAFLTAHGGVILRDLIVASEGMRDRNNSASAEVTVLWGIILSAYLEFNADNPDSDLVWLVIALITVGAFATSLAIYYLGINNLYFRIEGKAPITTTVTNSE